jgi:peroxiredoxin
VKLHTGRWFIFLGVGVWVFAVGFMYLHSWKERSPNGEAPSIGHTAPDFELQNLSGQSIRLGELRGHPVLINFWATWCGYCIDEMPFIEKYYERYASELIVLAVEVGDPIAKVRSVVTKNGYKFPILLDPDNLVYKKYRLNTFPVTFILDESGVIRVKHQGYMSEDKLVKYLDEVGLSQ